MFVFSLLSCSLKKKSKVEVTEHKTETLKEERKTDVQSVSNERTFVDSSKSVVYNDAVREVVETYKYAPPDNENNQYLQEYTRTTRDKQSHAKQVSNASAKSEIQDSTSKKDEIKQDTYSEAETKTKAKEVVKSNPPNLYIFAGFWVAIVLATILLRKSVKKFLEVLWNR